MTERLGVVIHRHNPAVADLAKRAIHWCGTDVGVVLTREDAEIVGRPDLAVPEAEFGPGFSACLSLGGDGTMLWASSLMASHEVPILGVNAGHLGYLTEIDPDHMLAALDEWRAGELATERRMMVDLLDADGQVVGRALNDVVIELKPGTACKTVGIDQSIFWKLSGPKGIFIGMAGLPSGLTFEVTSFFSNSSP